MAASEETLVVGNSSEQQAIDETEHTKACDHPTYKQYFKMVKVGVALDAVKQKMLLAGENPDVLDDPEATIPTE